MKKTVIKVESKPHISFIIPVLNEQRAIAGLLEDLVQRFPDSERIVVDGGSSDQTQTQAQGRCSKLIVSEPGRALQMNLGAASAMGSYLFFLHADTLPKFTAEDIDPYLERAPHWGFFPVQLGSSHSGYRVIEYAMNVRSRLTRVATGDQLIFVRRDVYAQIEGYADIALMEDIECCKRLRQLASPSIPPLLVETSTRRWRQFGITRTVIRMWGLRLAYFLGVSPARLRKHYLGQEH